MLRNPTSARGGLRSSVLERFAPPPRRSAVQLKLSGLALALCLGSSGLALSGSFTSAWAQPKSGKKGTVEVGSVFFLPLVTCTSFFSMGERLSKQRSPCPMML